MKPTWAAVVRSGQNESERNRVREIESKIKEDNQSREKERSNFENKKRLEDEEVERQRVMDALDRQKALDEVKAMAEVIVVKTAAEDLSDSVGDDSESTENSDNIGQGLDTTDTVKEGGSRALQIALQHKAWMEARAAGEVGEQVTITLHPELERIFGIWATRLALKIQGSVQNPHHLQEDESQVDGDGSFEEIELAQSENLSDKQEDESQDVCDISIEDSEKVQSEDQSDKGVDMLDDFLSSTPKMKRKRGRERFKSEGRESSGSLSPVRKSLSERGVRDQDVDLITLGSSFIT